MNSDTTTSEDSVNSGVDETQLEEQELETTEAVDENEVTSQTSESDDTESTEDETDAGNSEEAELKEWAATKNLPLDDPLKLAKMYREAEKQIGKQGQEKGQLSKAVTKANDDAGVDDVQALRNELTALSFKMEHPEAVELESTMSSILDDRPWMANDLEGVLLMAKGLGPMTDAQSELAARQAGKKEALEAAEKAGRAAQPRGSATNAAKAAGAKITIDNVDQLIAQNGQDWYMKNRDKINAVLAG